MKHEEEKEMIREAITHAIISIKDEILSHTDAQDNATRAKAIETLVRTYKRVEHPEGVKK